MNERYYVNAQAQSNGDHEVHVETCPYLPSLANRKYLGIHASCHEAVSEAKRYYSQVNGCIHCCPACHTQ